MKKTIKSSLIRSIATAMIVCLTLSLKAASFTWTGLGADNNWQTGLNWDTGTPASDGTATLIFSGDKRTGAANNYPLDTVFAGITFANDFSTGKKAAFTNSGVQIVLGGNITTTPPMVDGTITDVISLPMLLNGTRTLTINQGTTARRHLLAITGAIGETGGSHGLIKAGNSDLTLSGPNTYSGKTVINAGRLWINSLTNVSTVASALGLPTTAENGTIEIAGARLTYNGAVSTASDRLIKAIAAGATIENDTSSRTVTLTSGITNSGPYNVSVRGRGHITVTGPIRLGTSGFSRTDTGTLTLTHPDNMFGDVGISDGIISVDTVADKGFTSAIGSGNLISMGQQLPWDTTGRFLFTGATGGSCNRDFRILSGKGTTYGGIIENSVAGQTLVLSGRVFRGDPVTPTNGFAPLTLTGVGNGVLSGNISSNLCILKTGTGTWTLAGNNTNSGTNQVNAGTLLINGRMAMSVSNLVVVGTSGTLGGTGIVYCATSVSGTLSPADTNTLGTLTLANASLTGAKLIAELDSAPGVSDCVAVTNRLTLNGANMITLRFPNGTAPNGTYTLMTYEERAGLGTLTLDATYPNTFLTVGPKAVTVTISDVLTWTGSLNGTWDTATANWSPALYTEGASVLFDDTGSDTAPISIGSAVSPSFIAVNTSAKAYTFGGAGITGTASLIKSGTSTLTLGGANTYSGATAVNAGTLALSGSISNSSLFVATNAVFTQSAGSSINGDTAEINCQGIGTLSSANTYGGLTQVGIIGTSNRKLTVTHNNALGTTNAGTIVNGGVAAFNQESWLVLGNGVVITGELLTLNGLNNNRSTIWQNAFNGSIATWDGNIEIIGAAYIKCENPGGTLVTGGSSADTITGSTAGTSLNLRGNGTNIINSTISIGSTGVARDDVGVAVIQSTGNVWGDTMVAQGVLKLGCSEALPATTALHLGKSGNTSTAIFDLNGFNQTLSRLVDQHFTNGIQRITSALPATLIVSNTVDSFVIKEGSAIDGMISLVKANTGTLTLATTNAFSGALTVLGGTNVITATGTLGANCTNVTVVAGTLKLLASDGISDGAAVTIADGGAAKIELAGVEETVKWLILGDKPKLPGRYSATPGPGIIVDTVHFSGTGVLKVLRGPSATIITLK